MNYSSLLLSQCTVSLQGRNYIFFALESQHLEYQYLEYSGHSIKEHK